MKKTASRIFKEEPKKENRETEQKGKKIEKRIGKSKHIREKSKQLVDVSDLLEKHKSSLLRHDFRSFYKDLQETDFDLEYPDVLSKVVNRYKLMERKEYDELRKKHKKLSFSEEEIPISRVCELMVREHLLKKVRPETANKLRDYLQEREKILSMHTIGREATIHESPEDYADAETAYIKKITESYENYKKTDEYLEKKSEELAEKVVDEIGADEAEQSVEKLRSAISSQKEIHNAMKIHPRPIISEIDVNHHIEKHLNSFHDRLIRPFERIIGKKKKR